MSLAANPSVVDGHSFEVIKQEFVVHLPLLQNRLVSLRPIFHMQRWWIRAGKWHQLKLKRLRRRCQRMLRESNAFSIFLTSAFDIFWLDGSFRFSPLSNVILHLFLASPVGNYWLGPFASWDLVLEPSRTLQGLVSALIGAGSIQEFAGQCCNFVDTRILCTVDGVVGTSHLMLPLALTCQRHDIWLETQIFQRISHSDCGMAM